MSAVLEQSILGAMLLDADTALDGVATFRDDDFTRYANVFAAMRKCIDAHGAIDLALLASVLGDGSVGIIAQIANSVGTSMHYQHYKSELLRLRYLRYCQAQAQAITAAVAAGDDSKLYAAVDALQNADIDAGTDNVVDAWSAMQKSISDLEEKRKAGKKISGVATGFADYDVMTGGLQNGELTILAARPAMGKTSFALDVARKIAASGHVVIFSLEMTSEKLSQRLYTAATNTDNAVFAIQQGDALQWQRFLDDVGANDDFAKIAKNISIVDSGYMRIGDMRAILHKITKKHDVAAVVVDYLQLIVGNTKNGKTYEITEISRALKILARDFGIPFIVLSQLSRACEQRADHRPMLSDLRESGAIEQDADVVAFLYRDEYYFPDTTEKKNQGELIIAKNRNGPTGTVPLVWIPEYTSYRSMGWTQDIYMSQIDIDKIFKG